MADHSCNKLHAILYFSGAAVFCFALHRESHLLDDVPVNEELRAIIAARVRWGGVWRYLTVWALAVQCVYCCISAARVTLCGSCHSTAPHALDAMFVGWAFPLSLIVSFMFWTLYLLDPALVLPAQFQPFYPSWLNHCVHTLPVLFNVTDMAVVRRRRLPPRCITFSLLTVFLAAYLVWTLYLGVVAEVWVYPVFRVLQWPGRIALMGASSVLALAFCQLGYTLHACFCCARRDKTE